jgi:hypothetical protein
VTQAWLIPEVGVPTVDLLPSRPEEPRPVILLGVDPHKSTHTATAVDPAANRSISTSRIEATCVTTAGCWPGRKNDTLYAIDVAAAALQSDARPVPAEDHTMVLALLDERRGNLARVRAANQLHALLRDLLPGGARSSRPLRQRDYCGASARPDQWSPSASNWPSPGP